MVSSRAAASDQCYAFINELAEILEHAGVYVKLFADDVKLYFDITSSCDADKLQHALNLLVQWAGLKHGS